MTVVEGVMTFVRRSQTAATGQSVIRIGSKPPSIAAAVGLAPPRQAPGR